MPAEQILEKDMREYGDSVFHVLFVFERLLFESRRCNTRNFYLL